MPMTTFWRNKTGDHSIGETDIGALVDTYLALFTGDPGDSGSQLTEVTGTGYARQLLTGHMSAFAAGESTNDDEISFGSPGSDWGTPAYVGVMDASMGGNMRYREAIPNPRAATSGSRPVKFAVGQLTIRHI